MNYAELCVRIEIARGIIHELEVLTGRKEGELEVMLEQKDAKDRELAAHPELLKAVMEGDEA